MDILDVFEGSFEIINWNFVWGIVIVFGIFVFIIGVLLVVKVYL